MSSVCGNKPRKGPSYPMQLSPEQRAQCRRIENYLISQNLVATTPTRAKALVDALLLIDYETGQAAHIPASTYLANPKMALCSASVCLVSRWFLLIFATLANFCQRQAFFGRICSKVIVCC